MGDPQQNPNQQAPDGAGAGAGSQPDGGRQDTRTPEQIAAHNAALTADLVKERERRRAAEDALKTKETAEQLAAAKTAEELQKLREQTAADIAAERRRSSIAVAAAAAGVHDAFVTQADDGKAAVDEVLKAAKAAQDKFLKDSGRPGTINMGGGNSPDGGGGRVWKASEVRKLTPAEYRKHEPEIKRAAAEGRFREDQ